MYFWFTFIFHYLESISIIPNMTENKIVIKDINFVWILFIFYINMFFFLVLGSPVLFKFRHDRPWQPAKWIKTIQTK